MSSLLRPPLFVAVVAASLLTAGGASAQDAGATAAFTGDDLFIGVQVPKGHNLSDFDVVSFFNKAHCDCDAEVFIYVALNGSGLAKRAAVNPTGNIEFWVGTDCGNDDVARQRRCIQLDAPETPTLAAFLNNDGRATIPTTARVLSTFSGGTPDGGAVSTFTSNPDCTLPVESFAQTIFVIVPDGQTGAPMVLSKRQVLIDLTPPPAPDSNAISAVGGGEAVTISWPGVDSSIYTDLLGYQVLCNRGGDLQVFADGTFQPGYHTCPATVAAGSGVQGLDPLYTCSPLLSAATRSFRIKGLQNDITYGAAVVAIDRHGNASTPDVFYATAIKTTSFYDNYRNGEPNPGGADGGLCALGAGTTSRGTAAGLGAALVLAATVVARRRRRR